MRILSSLLMLLGVAGVSAQSAIVFEAVPATSSAGWKVVNNAVLNPLVNVTGGTTTTFDVSQVTQSHPFILSLTNTPTSTANPIGENGPLYKVWSSAGCTNETTTGPGSTKYYVGNGQATTPLGTCVVSLWANTTAVGQNIFYKCSVHPGMVGQISVVAAAGGGGAGTTAPPTGTTAPPTGTTAPPTATTSPPTNPTGPLTGQTLSGTNFKITAADITNGWTFTDAANKQYQNPTLSVQPGTTLTFSLEYPTGIPHPFALSPKNDDFTNFDANFFPDDLNKDTKNTTVACDKPTSVNAFTTKTTGTPCVITIPVPTTAAGQTVYYRCAYHTKMKGTIIVAGKNSASIVGAGIAFVVAAITALFA